MQLAVQVQGGCAVVTKYAAEKTVNRRGDRGHQEEGGVVVNCCSGVAGSELSSAGQRFPS